MNLHSVVRGAVTTVNPDTTCTLKRSTGYTTGTNGKQVPNYTTTTGPANVQATGGRDVERMNNLGFQGVFRTLYLYGNWQGIVRVDQKGGDLFLFPQEPGGAVCTWKAASVKETWPDWCGVIVILQIDPPPAP